jgi:hypothetical protein
MKSLKSIGLMLFAALAFNVSFAQMGEKTVEVGGAPCILQKILWRMQ